MIFLIRSTYLKNGIVYKSMVEIAEQPQTPEEWAKIAANAWNCRGADIYPGEKIPYFDHISISNESGENVSKVAFVGNKWCNVFSH